MTSASAPPTLGPVLQYWHEPEPPEAIRETLASFAEHNPGRPHLVFDRRGAEAFIAASLGERYAHAFRACGVPSMQSDYFRYCSVLARGGVYADADLRCVRALGQLEVDEAKRGVVFGREEPIPEDPLLYKGRDPVGPFRAVGTGVLAFRDPGDPLLDLAVEIATTGIEQRIDDGPSGIWLVGPGIFTALYMLRELGSIAAFADYAAVTALAPLIDPIRDVVAVRPEAASLLDGVEIRPRSARKRWVDVPGIPPYGVHWTAVEGTIYDSSTNDWP